MKGRAKLLDPLRDNLYRRAVDGSTGQPIMEKSCPKCSKKAGVAIYYPEHDFDKPFEAGARNAAHRDCQKHRKAARTLQATEPVMAPEPLPQ